LRAWSRPRGYRLTHVEPVGRIHASKSASNMWWRSEESGLRFIGFLVFLLLLVSSEVNKFFGGFHQKPDEFTVHEFKFSKTHKNQQKKIL
jgi:hypothetical protein